jgi:mycothiol system anti-sigma-R factor
MKGCDDYRDNLQLYFDKELGGQDLVEFRAHLEQCAVCRQALKEEELSRLLHRSRPLYSAPDALRERVLKAVTEPAAESLPEVRPKGKR